MDNLRKFMDLKEKAEQLARKSERARGALEQLLEQLKRDYGIDSIEKAKKEIAKGEKEEEGLEKEIAELQSRFITDWEEKLGEL